MTEQQTVFFGICVPATKNAHGSNVVKTDLGDFTVLSVFKTKELAREHSLNGYRLASVARHESKTTFISWVD